MFRRYQRKVCGKTLPLRSRKQWLRQEQATISCGCIGYLSLLLLLSPVDPWGRIDGFAMIADFEVKTWFCHGAGIANCGDNLPRFDGVSFFLKKLFGIRIEGVIVVAMINNDHIAVAFEPAGIKRFALVYSVYGLPSFSADIDTASEINELELGVCVRPEKLDYLTVYRHD